MICIGVREKRRHDEDHKPKPEKHPVNPVGDTGEIGMNAISVSDNLIHKTQTQWDKGIKVYECENVTDM